MSGGPGLKRWRVFGWSPELNLTLFCCYSSCFKQKGNPNLSACSSALISATGWTGPHASSSGSLADSHSPTYLRLFLYTTTFGLLVCCIFLYRLLWTKTTLDLMFNQILPLLPAYFSTQEEVQQVILIPCEQHFSLLFLKHRTMLCLSSLLSSVFFVGQSITSHSHQTPQH